MLVPLSAADADKTKEQLAAELDRARLRIAELEDARSFEARLAMGEVEKRYREMIELAPVGIFQSTPEGRYLWANARLIRMYGYDSLEDLLANIQDITAQVYLDRAEREAIRRTLVEGGGLDMMEVRRRRKDGSVIWVALSMRAVRDWNGAIVRYEGFVRDITVRKRDEELRRQIEVILEHDLRAPANNAVIVARLLRAAPNLDPQQQRLLDLFELAARNMQEILNSSLTLYKIESGHYQARPSAVDGLALVRSLARTLTLHEGFEDRPLDIRMDGRPPAPGAECPVLAESGLLRIALQNLLVNALEASPELTPVRVDLAGDGPGWRAAIINRGAVAPGMRERFFEKFASQGKPHGTGLGTYSALMMVRAMGGDVAMRTSDEADETVVTVTLPRP
jgi:PAS domain S-box-containing protein